LGQARISVCAAPAAVAAMLALPACSNKKAAFNQPGTPGIGDAGGGMGGTGGTGSGSGTGGGMGSGGNGY
jgi:hypothetical protein